MYNSSFHNFSIINFVFKINCLSTNQKVLLAIMPTLIALTSEIHPPPPMTMSYAATLTAMKLICPMTPPKKALASVQFLFAITIVQPPTALATVATKMYELSSISSFIFQSMINSSSRVEQNIISFLL